jgi:FMN phosphatase YigB (HAD superfamily)
VNVLLDVDGVVYDFNRRWKQIAAARTGVPLDHRQSGWIPEGKAEMLEEIMKGHDVWLTGKPYPGVLQKLDSLHKEGIRFFAVSHVPAHAEADRMAWINRWGLPIDKFVATQDKARAALDLGLTVSIDDKQENAQALRDAGVHSILLARWWNHCEDGLDRLTWRQVPERLLELQHAEL